MFWIVESKINGKFEKKKMTNYDVKQFSNDIKELKMFYPYEQIFIFLNNPLKITRINKKNPLILSKNSMQREILRKETRKSFILTIARFNRGWRCDELDVAAS